MLWAAGLLCVLGAVSGQQTVSSVIVLTNDNFEHLTQASTGATTGDWFVKFYAPWSVYVPSALSLLCLITILRCGHCKAMASTWTDLASKMHQKANIAEVDCTTDKTVCSRFGIRGFPTLLYLKGGKYQNYKGRRDLSSMQSFAEARGGDDSEWEEVPGMPGFVAEAFGKFEQFMLTKWFSEDPMINAVILGLSLGVVVIGLCVCCMAIVFPDDDFDDNVPGGPVAEGDKPKKPVAADAAPATDASPKPVGAARQRTRVKATQ